ncbi:MAG: sigma-70 family RNA polymerase sigma factor [Planctomycetes bacterium]|nr:sigma-70 family RNA polymerase sigma factor [Planctomycetota bacterium]
MPGTSVEEMEIVARARGGDVAAFTALVRRYENRIYNLAFRMLGNADDAADVAQETFLAAYEGLGRFRAESTLYTWLYRIAVNKALSRRRAKSSRREFVPADDPSPLLTAASRFQTPDEVAEETERAGIVQDAVSRLPGDLRAVVVLRDIEGLEYEEIAAVLELALGTVKSRLHRARLSLRGTLARHLGVTP